MFLMIFMSYTSSQCIHRVTPKLLETRAKLKSLQKRVADHDKSKARVQKVSILLLMFVLFGSMV